MASGFLSEPTTTNTDATRTNWEKVPTHKLTNHLLYFLTCAETRDLVTVNLVKASILRFHLASEPVEVNVHPQSW